jgi:UDP-glucose 4-epimerase
MTPATDTPRLLVTGATGKVGQAFLARFVEEPRYAGFDIRALCHNRTLEHERIETVHGSIADRDVARAAMRDVTHVVHLATVKETPDEVMDVTVKGLFWLLEEARSAERFDRFLLLGGDAAVGHFFYPRPVPVTEEQPHTAYPGCYALSKVLEEVMLEQYHVQYDLGGCCLRAPWIVEKDDLKASLSFGDDQFGGPRWRELVGDEAADRYEQDGTVPVLCDPDGEPIKRNFVHVHDLVEAMLVALDHPAAHQETFHVCMDEPVDYRALAEHLAATRGLPSVDVCTTHHSTWLDNTKARFLLGWRPRYDLARLVDEAWDHERAPDDPRHVWYPG